MVERQKKRYGWEFLFLGANIDAIAEAGRFGIRPTCAVNYECDKEGTAVNYRALSKTISAVRACSAPSAGMVLDESWKQEIEADYQRRHK